MDIKKELERVFRVNECLVSKKSEIALFISQFDENDVWIVLRLLENFRFIDQNSYENLLVSMYEKVAARKFRNPLYVGLGFASESGVKMATDFRRANNHIPTASFINYTEWDSFDFSGFDSIILFDDVVGSGRQAIGFLKEKIGNKNINKKIIYICLAATNSGINNIRAAINGVEIICLISLDEGGIFKNDDIFDDPLAAKKICERLGGRLDKNNPLGFNGGALLIAFPDNTPNNTLPIFWSTKGGWKAPFPRKPKKSKKPSIHRPKGVGIMSRTTVNLHGYEVENIAKLQRFDPPLKKEQLGTKLKKQKVLPSEISKYYEENIDSKIKEIEKSGKTVTINKGYSVQCVDIYKNDGVVDHTRDHGVQITFEFADYSHQIMFGERIHEDGLIEFGSKLCSIADFAKLSEGVDFESFDWPDVSKVPVYQRGANVLALRVPIDKAAAAQEKCLIIPLRSKSVYVQNSGQSEHVWQASLTCAEGMLRPADALSRKEELPPSPFNTVARALEEEMGLSSSEYSENDIELLGLAYDSNRCQPVFVFFIELDSLDSNDIYDRWKGDAIDANENKDLIYIETNPDDYAEFLMGNKEYNEKRVELFSNHQKIGAALVGERIFGGSLKNLQLKGRKVVV